MNKAKMILKYPGAKWRIADWIISNMPEHHSYVEPYFGSGAVLFRKTPSKIETINDLDDDVINLFEVVRNNAEPLVRAVTYTPFSRKEYENAFTKEPVDEIEKARRFLVRCWQGHGFRNINGHRSGWKNDVQGREAAYALRNWYRLPQWIEMAVERLREVQIEKRPAVEVIQRFNYPNVLIYADPPYVLSTRSGKNYNHEMSDADHVELCETLLKHKGSVILSGYDNEIYNEYMRDWKKLSIDTTAEKGLKRVEVIWIKEGMKP
ncbi:MAG: DNA adenine methylase [Clostridia bacterium]|nr:DNA adenine methylase [Clostridia bacterium]